MRRFWAKIVLLMRSEIHTKALLKTVLTALVLSFAVVYIVSDSFFDSFDSAKTGSLVIVSGMLWLGLFDAILEVSNRRDQMAREFSGGQDSLTDGVAIVAVRLLHTVLQTACMLGVSLALLDMPDDAPTLLFGTQADYALVLFAIGFSSQMLGLAVSALAKDNVGALKMAPPVLIFELIVSGMLIGLPEQLENFTGLTICRWGVEAIGSVFNINALDWSIEQKYADFGYNFFNTHDDAAFLATPEHFGEALVWLFVLAVVMMIVTFVCLEIFRRNAWLGKED